MKLIPGAAVNLNPKALNVQINARAIDANTFSNTIGGINNGFGMLLRGRWMYTVPPGAAGLGLLPGRPVMVGRQAQ